MIEYIDATGCNRSKRFDLLRRITLFVPNRIARSLWYRLLDGSPVLWPSSIIGPSNGTLKISDKVAISDDVLFGLPEGGLLELATGVVIAFQTKISMQIASSIVIGSNSYVGTFCNLEGSGGLTIGSKVMIGPYCSINTANHGMSTAIAYQDQPLICKAVSIEDNVWIGAHCTIVPGVTIGTGAIVAAGSVVANNVDPFTLVAGVPARSIRQLTTIS